MSKNRLNTKNTVQSIIRQQVSLKFEGGIPRQSTTVIEVPNGTLTVRGQTALTQTAWAIYKGYLGHWQALITPSLRVSSPTEVC